ncbi:hypothetical protein PMI29_03576 [Pseudomonas sp. GM49]|jgi:hypothetical protein|nr:hypothetical protein PMI29_03576 [Pseudomonas sp. GM49]
MWSQPLMLVLIYLIITLSIGLLYTIALMYWL